MARIVVHFGNVVPLDQVLVKGIRILLKNTRPHYFWTFSIQQPSSGDPRSRQVLLVIADRFLDSGDDHDYCEHIHHFQPDGGSVRTVREVSVRSLSMVMNVMRPGFQLLSLAPAELRQGDSASHADVPCLLPNQMQIYLERYLPLIAISMLVIFFSNVNGIGLSGGGRSQVPLKKEDDDSIELDDEVGTPPMNTGQTSTHVTRNYRSLRGRGWVMFQAAATRQEPSVWQYILDTLKLYWAKRPSGMSLRRRRLWLRCLRDIRDVSVLPIIVFSGMSWWVIVY